MSTAVVAGVGEGLGDALCRVLTQHGYSVVALGRALPADVEAHRIALNLSDRVAVDAAFDEIERGFDPPSVVIYNAHQLVIRNFAELGVNDFRRAWESAALGAFHIAQRALHSMSEGTLIFTGATASLRGSARFAAYASAKFALRGLAQSLAREYGPRGIHVAHVVLDGLIWCPQTRDRFDPEQAACMDPDAIAAVYLNLVAQSRTAWTHELDLRPAGERF